jgi:hypothetical protein
MIEAIQAIFPPQFFSRFSSHGNTVWTPQKVFWFSVVMSWHPDTKIEEQFESARAVLRKVFPRWTVGTSVSGFVEARTRLLEEMRGPVMLWLQVAVSQYFPEWRVRGWSLFGVDGSRFETCRTNASEEGLGCAGKESTTPQVFQTTLLHIGTGLTWDFRLGPGTDSERRHLDAMLPLLPERSMLTADAGFISIDLCRWLVEKGHVFLLRVGSNVHLLADLGWAVEVEGKTVYLWPKKQRHLPPMVLRLIVVTKEDRKPVYLVTNILDEAALSDEDAAEIYKLRWQLELYYRAIKQTLGHTTLRSRKPETSLAEQTWHVLATWVLQMITVRQLIAAGEAPASWSAAKARDAARALLRGAHGGDTCYPAQTFRKVLQSATTIDHHRRTGPKQIRKWPRKKQDKPPGPPKIQPATEEERLQAQRVREETSNKS